MKTQSLLFKFGVVFALFTLITIVVSSISTYINQNQVYLEECESRVQKLSTHLEAEIQRDREEYAAYQKIMLQYYDEINIPMDFDNYIPAKNAFYDRFGQEYPEQVPGIDVPYDKMSDVCE